MDCSPPGSSVHGVLQVRILEWAAMPSSRGSYDPGVEPASLTSPALTGEFFTTRAPWESCRKKFRSGMELVGGHFLKIREISSFNYYIRGCYLESFPILCTDIMETERLYFLGLQNHCRWWLQPRNWKTLVLRRKAMTNLENRDITLPTKVCLVKAMVFPGVMYGCESWTIKKAER